MAESCASSRIHKMQERICSIKSSEEVSVKYMQRWEELQMEREEARNEGRDEAELNLIRRMKEKGYQIEQIVDLLNKTQVEIEELLENL